GTLAPFDANGYNYICTAVSCCEPLPRERKGALIGKIGNQVFFIGNGGSFTAGANGVLQLRINDCDHNLGDNTGSVIVRITR
ncbi:MAG: LecA/PA-IL family lectin, partial [Candidatus Methanosuratincola sp.]